jgi:short-subunit dehydrogenase
MKLEQARILLTGSAGGIGGEIAHLLAKRSARLALVDFNRDALDKQVKELHDNGADTFAIAADLSKPRAWEDIRRSVQDHWRDGLDCIIHAAGVMAFQNFETLSSDAVHRILTVNVEAPMQLTRTLLPGMLARGQGTIVCIGSILGALAMPYFTAYSASKFAVRGFAEALRRELAGTGVRVCYIGPRSVRTPLNNTAIQDMAAATGMHMDEPAAVADKIVRAIEMDRVEVHLGFPERLFARLNQLLPRLIDRGMRGQSETMGRFARTGT